MRVKPVVRVKLHFFFLCIWWGGRPMPSPGTASRVNTPVIEAVWAWFFINSFMLICVAWLQVFYPDHNLQTGTETSIVESESTSQGMRLSVHCECFLMIHTVKPWGFHSVKTTESLSLSNLAFSEENASILMSLWQPMQNNPETTKSSLQTFFGESFPKQYNSWPQCLGGHDIQIQFWHQVLDNEWTEMRSFNNPCHISFRLSCAFMNDNGSICYKIHY